MAQSDLRLTGGIEPRNETARLRGGPHRPAKPGKHLFVAVQIFPENLPSRQAENGRFRQRRSFTDLRTTPATGSTARRGNACLLLSCHSWSRKLRGLVCGTSAGHSCHRARLDLTVCLATSKTSFSRPWPRSAIVMPPLRWPCSSVASGRRQDALSKLFQSTVARWPTIQILV